MRQTLQRLWQDDAGALIATEWVFVATILVLGIITGLVALRQALISEMIETAQALVAINASFFSSGQSNCESSTAGSSASDTVDTITNVRTEATTATIEQSPCD